MNGEPTCKSAVIKKGETPFGVHADWAWMTGYSEAILEDQIALQLPGCRQLVPKQFLERGQVWIATYHCTLPGCSRIERTDKQEVIDGYDIFRGGHSRMAPKITYWVSTGLLAANTGRS